MDFVGAPELLVILVVMLIFFGPTKLPKLARSIGEAAHEFRRSGSADDDRNEGTKTVDANRPAPPSPGDSFS